jgi:hypothetical protein
MNELIKQLSSGTGIIIVITLAVLFLAWKVVVFIHPHISNKEQVTDISGDLRLLSEEIKSLNKTLLTLYHDHDIRITKVEENLKYLQKEVDKNKEP